MRSAPCLLTLKDSSGVISSESSAKNKVCRWVIAALSQHHIKLKFTIFQLSDSHEFGRNLIQVYDGRTKNKKSLGVFTGTRRPFNIQSSGQFMVIKLTKKFATSLCNFKGVYTSNTTKGEHLLVFFYISNGLKI